MHCNGEPNMRTVACCLALRHPCNFVFVKEIAVFPGKREHA